MNEPGLRRTLPEQFSGSGHTFGTQRHQSVTNPILSKRVCFYKSGDPQFNGLRMVINSRTFKTFDALLDSLSKKVPLPFGVRNITTPRGVHAVSSLDELEDGKSYICSDHRKVKPINLAMARKKPPPWYNARPVSSRRHPIQKAQLYPGHKLHNPELVLIRTPKKLLVFRNGDPSMKCVVVVQKKTTLTFEGILRYISELMQFSVAKLYTPDGRRVDGLPGLIMCSGTVVAAGREKFKPSNYISQKSFEPTQKNNNRKNNRRSVRRLKALNHKKRSFAMKPRILSPSSERYIVSQIHNTMAEHADSVPTNSIEMESIHVMDSVAESEGENFAAAATEGQDCLLPTDDDIEKSFRVNQDGSMTVEMKVRLTIKEEETLQWTTTLSRSCVSSQLTEDSFLAPGPEQEISLPESDHMELGTPAAATNGINKDLDICNKEPTAISNGDLHQCSYVRDNSKTHEDLISPLRTPPPGQKQIRTKQASVESIKSPTAESFQEDIVGSYFREHLENGDLTEQFCMLKHTNSKPIPKPRRVSSVETNSHNILTYKSAGMTEIYQIDSCGEVTETVMHIYEQQTCQDNFFANVCAQDMPIDAVNCCRPSTSDTCHHSTNSDFQSEPYRPSTASEPVSLWRSESISLKSNLSLQSQITNPTYTQSLPQEPIKRQNKKGNKNIKKERRVSPKHKVTIKRLKSPGNMVKEGKNKKDKTLTSTRLINKIYGNKLKSTKEKTEEKKRNNSTEARTTNDTHQEDELKTGMSFSEPREIFTQQPSPNQTKQRRNSTVPLPVMSNSAANEYVEHWLEKSQSKPPHYPEGESETDLKSKNLNMENDPCLMSVAEKVKCLKEIPETLQSSAAPLPALTRNGSVRQKVKSFESKYKDTSGTDNPTSNSSLKHSKDLPTDMVHKTELIIVQFEGSSNSVSADLPPSPTESLPELSSLHAADASAASSPLYLLSSVSDIHPLSTSPTSDRAISPTDHTIDMVSSIQTDNPLELREAPLQRAPSIKRAPLVSNLSLERKMSLKKASLDEYTIPKESMPLHFHTVADDSLVQSKEPAAERLISKSTVDLKSRQLYCGSTSPSSLSSDHRTSSTSMLSNETQSKQSKEKELVSPKPKKVKLISNTSEPKHQTKKTSSEIMKKSPRLDFTNNLPTDKNTSPNVERKMSTTPSASPASEKRLMMSKPKLLKKASPYSQSLDLASPPIKHRVSKRSLYRNLSTDSPLTTTNKPFRKMSQKRMDPTPLSQTVKSKPEKTMRNELTSYSLNTESTYGNYDVAQNISGAVTVKLRNEVCEFTMTENQKKECKTVISEKHKSQTEMFDSDCYVELNVGKPTSTVSPDNEIEYTSASDADRMEVHSAVEDTAADIDEISMSEEDLLSKSKELNVIAEEHLSDEEQDIGVTCKKQVTNSDAKINFENDSGNYLSSCEDISTNNEITSNDEEQCSHENEIRSENKTEVKIWERCSQTLHSEDERIENIAKKLCDDVIAQSVSEHVTYSEKIFANGLRNGSSLTSPLQKELPLASDGEESSPEFSITQLSPCTRSAPQSSLSFSYDSACVITKQPEGNRVKSIREMFLAKSASDSQPNMNPSLNTSGITELQAETALSGGYQSQTSNELSNDDDSARTSISKGFVMRTIERLYGKKEPTTKVDKSDRPLSAQKEKKKDQTSIFSPFHTTRPKTVSELSYFNSSHAMDAISEATRCIAFNAQVGPGECVLIDNERCFLQETPNLRKSVSDPVAINLNLSTTTQEEQQLCKDTAEKTPYLLFKTDSEDEHKLQSRKCTYFSLPHASDSEAVLEESLTNTDLKGDICCESKDSPDIIKTQSEKNGKLRGCATDFKMMDNKVHPLVEVSPAEKAVVVQPVRGQGVLNRRQQESDVLDVLYNFCGEHCPIL